jgi:hypothetical protein
MAKPPRTWATLLRGLYGAILGAVFGAVVPAAIVLAGAACWWHAWGSAEIDRAYDRHAVLPDIPGLVVVGATLFACAGWATLAPRGRHRFTRTLTIVVAITVPLWCVVGWVVRSMELTPVRYKGIEHPAWYPSEMAVAIVCLVIPIVVAAVLTAVRGRDASKSDTVASGSAAADAKTGLAG